MTMTHEYDDELEDDVTPDPEADDDTPAGLRRAAKDGKRAKAEANRLARENAMLKAGIDTDSPVGQMFAKAYDGELTKDAVKAAWSALGVTPAAVTAEPEPEPEVTLEAGEADSTRERQALANGSAAETTAPRTTDPIVAMHAAREAVIAKGGRQEDALAAGIAELIASDHPDTFVKNATV